MMRTIVMSVGAWLAASTLFAATLQTKGMWARKAPPGIAMTAVYGELKNTGSKPLVVMRLETPIAGKASLHETVTEGGLSRMKPIERLALAPGESVAFVPGGKHIMLEKLKEGWSASDKMTLRVTYDDGSTQDVAVLIQETP